MAGRVRRSAGTAVVVLLALLMPAAGRAAPTPALAAPQPVTLPFAPVADTTHTQIAADGNNATKTTLATCPALCDEHPQARRDAFVEFSLTGLPADAVVTRASLELYSWNPYPARMSAHAADGGAASTGAWQSRPPLGAALATRDAVAAGFNAFDVTAAVAANGRHTFALLQQTHHTRVYWASRDNSNASLRPRLRITYQTSAPWRLVWQDSFDGTALNTANWTARPLTRVGFDRACITNRPQNVFVAGGTLTLRAARETLTCGSETRPYTTAYLDSIGKATFTYGRFETRAKSPNGRDDSTGLWPAFWLRRTAVSAGGDAGDANGELDVVELPGGPSYYRASTAAIFRDYTPTKNDFRYPFPAGTFPGDGFHVYAVEWEPDVLRFYVDGALIWTRTPQTTSWFDDVFNGDARYHLRLTFHVGGWLGDPNAATAFPADFEVDYVRVWQR